MISPSDRLEPELYLEVLLLAATRGWIPPVKRQMNKTRVSISDHENHRPVEILKAMHNDGTCISTRRRSWKIQNHVRGIAADVPCMVCVQLSRP
jgi:hypothetical protein